VNSSSNNGEVCTRPGQLQVGSAWITLEYVGRVEMKKLDEKDPTVLALRAVYGVVNEPVRPFPFPHSIINDVFDSNELHTLISNWPSEHEFLPISSVTKISQSYDTRRIIDLFNDNSVAAVSSQKRNFWLDFRDAICSDKVAAFILGKYRDYWASHPAIAKLGKLSVRDLRFWLYLQEDLNGFFVNPHTQHPSELVVNLFYLPRRENSVSAGTSIYIPKNIEGLQSDGYQVEDRQKFLLLKTVPYVEGGGLSFFKTRESWHGVEPINEPVPRRSIYFTIGIAALAK
jgi:hypothetical protein